jgi:WD40 repeat protein
LLRVWELPPADAHEYRLPGTALYSLVRLSPDGRHVLASGGNSRACAMRTTQIHDVATGKEAGPQLPAGGILMDAAFSPDGRQVALAASVAASPAQRHNQPGQQPGRLTLWACRTGKETVDVLELPVEPRKLDYSPDGRFLVVIDARGEVVLVDPATNRVVRQWQAHPPQLENNHHQNNGAVCFTPDSKSVITYGTRANAARVWDVATGTLRFALEHRGTCREVQFSADGKLVATASFDNTARVWELSTGRPLAELTHPDWVMLATFSPDGQRLLTGCRDGMARLWDWQTGRLVNPAFEHEHEIHAATFTPDGLRVVTVGDDKVLRLWETATGKPLTPPLPLGGAGLSVLVTPDGKRAIAGGFLDALPVFYLPDWLTPAPLTADDLCTLGELLSGQRVHESGGVINLTAAEWLDRWRTFSAVHHGKGK